MQSLVGLILGRLATPKSLRIGTKEGKCRARTKHWFLVRDTDGLSAHSSEGDGCAVVVAVAAVRALLVVILAHDVLVLQVHVVELPALKSVQPAAAIAAAGFTAELFVAVVRFEYGL